MAESRRIIFLSCVAEISPHNCQKNYFIITFGGLGGKAAAPRPLQFFTRAETLHFCTAKAAAAQVARVAPVTSAGATEGAWYFCEN